MNITSCFILYARQLCFIIFTIYRNIIKACTNAGKDDVVVFTGSGATAGMHKVAWALRVNNPRVAAETV